MTHFSSPTPLAASTPDCDDDDEIGRDKEGKGEGELFKTPRDDSLMTFSHLSQLAREIFHSQRTAIINLRSKICFLFMVAAAND